MHGYNIAATAENAKKQAETATEVYRMSDLQKDILRTVCKNKQADYDLLENLLDKDRVSLLKSTHTLIDKRLVHNVRTIPDKQKSRQIFHPTDKGMCVALGFIDGVNYTDLRNNHPDNLFSKVFEPDIKSDDLKNQMAIIVAKNLLFADAFDVTGHRKEDITFDKGKRGYHVEFDADRLWQFLSNINNIYDLERIFSKDYMQKMKQQFQESANELQEIIKQLEELGY